MSSESIGLFISLLLPLSSFLDSVTWLSYFHSCVFSSILLPTKPFFKELLKWAFVAIVVQLLSYIWLFVTAWTVACQVPHPSLSSGACSDSCPLSWWCYLTISSSVTSFSFCPQSFLASRSFPMSQLFASGGQGIGASASASVLPINIQDWFLLGLTGLILHSKGLSRVFSSTPIWQHQFFNIQPSLWSSSRIHTWQLEKP